MSVKKLVESMIIDILESDLNIGSVLEDVRNEINKKYGLETSLSKSNIGRTPSFFLKVFGPKSTWTNNIALNSPVSMTIHVSDNKIEMINNSYQIRNAKAKMRATKFSSEEELKKKLLAYFSKNAPKFKEILGESLTESRDQKLRNHALKAAHPFGGAAEPSQEKLLDALEKEGFIEVTSYDPLDNSIFYELTAKGKAHVKSMKEDLDESQRKMNENHKTFTDAVNTAKEKAEKAGYTIDDDEWFRKVSSGPRKPGTDKTNRYTIELLTKKGNPARKHLHFQVYNTGGAYELNAYIN